MAYLGIRLPIYPFVLALWTYVHFFDMSVSKPLVTPIHSGKTCVNTTMFFFRKMGTCVSSRILLMRNFFWINL